MSTATSILSPTARMTTRAHRAGNHWTDNGDGARREDRRSQSRRERQDFRAVIARGDWED